MLEVTAEAKVLEKDYVNLTPLGQLMEGLFRFDPKNIGKYVEGKISELFKYDVSDQLDSLDISKESEGFKYWRKYKAEESGKLYDVYVGSNKAIAKLLDEHGKNGHKSGKFNYGAAFNGKIYVNEQILYGSLDSGKIDPFSGHKYTDVLENVLAHEYGHLEHGLEEKGARDFAAIKSPVRI